jgi:hypothetical protein
MYFNYNQRLNRLSVPLDTQAPSIATYELAQRIMIKKEQIARAGGEGIYVECPESGESIRCTECRVSRSRALVPIDL